MNKKRKRRFSLFWRNGQATTEMVLLLPLFIIFLWMLIRMFGLLMLRQKMEIAALYAARRWQIEAHRDENYATWDKNVLLNGDNGIRAKAEQFIGLKNPAMRRFMDLSDIEVDITRYADVWDRVSITVRTKPMVLGILCQYDKNTVCANERIRTNCLRGYDYTCEGGGKISIAHFVEKKPRPVAYIVPDNVSKGVQNTKLVSKSKG